MYRPALALALIAASLIAAPGSAGAQSAAVPAFTIVGDRSIAGFPRDGTMRGAIARFGQPATREPAAAVFCTLKWPRLGITMETAINYYVSEEPCVPAARHVTTTLTDRRWRTSAGLRIGDTQTRLRRLYPRARRPAPGEWWLITRPFAGMPMPTLEARVVNGRVVSFIVHGPRRTL